MQRTDGRDQPTHATRLTGDAPPTGAVVASLQSSRDLPDVGQEVFFVFFPQSFLPIVFFGSWWWRALLGGG